MTGTSLGPHSCQHQRVSPCEGQDKIFYNMNVTANFVGLNTECMLGERKFSSSSGSLCEHMVNECQTENVPFCTQRDPTLCKKRVCELEEKQWRTDRNESGSTPCLVANCGELNTECTGDGGAFAGVPRRAAMTGDRNTASSGSLHEKHGQRMSHRERAFLHQARPYVVQKNVYASLRRSSGTQVGTSPGQPFNQQRQGCNECDESRAEGDPHVTSPSGEVSDLGKTCPQQGDLTIEEREDLLALLIGVRNELRDRGEDALIELVYQLMDRMLDDDTSEIADDARATIPRLHHLWCGTARRFDLTIDDSDEEGDSDEGDGFAALVHGTPERYATGCTSGPRRRPSSRREGLRPVCRVDGALRGVDLLCRATPLGHVFYSRGG